MKIWKLKKVIFLLSLSFGFACNIQKQAEQTKEFKFSSSASDYPVILEVEDYLNEKNSLFTLTIINKGNEQIELKNSQIVYPSFDSNKNNFTHFLYNVENIELQAYNKKPELTPVVLNKYMIDDNYVNYSEKEGYTIHNAGKSVGFLPKPMEKGIYQLQIVLTNKKLKKTVYSNIIEIEVPLSILIN